MVPGILINVPGWSNLDYVVLVIKVHNCIFLLSIFSPKLPKTDQMKKIASVTFNLRIFL